MRRSLALAPAVCMAFSLSLPVPDTGVQGQCSARCIVPHEVSGAVKTHERVIA